MTSYYIAQFREEIKAQAVTYGTNTTRENISDWFDSLPEAEKKRQWSLEELSVRFNRPQQIIAQALHSLGWQRRRRWSTDGGPYVRVWVGQ